MGKSVFFTNKWFLGSVCVCVCTVNFPGIQSTCLYNNELFFFPLTDFDAEVYRLFVLTCSETKTFA